jgi:hypothetical protein
MTASNVGWMLVGAAVLWAVLGFVGWAMVMIRGRKYEPGDFAMVFVAMVMGPFALAIVVDCLRLEREGLL